MLAPTIITVLLAALPTAFAQGTNATTYIATRCTTRFGFTPLPTGIAGAPTWYSFTTATNIARITYTTHETVSVTPVATTYTDLVRLTTTISTTTTTTPVATTIATPKAFLPLLLVNMANPTPIPRIKRRTYLSSSESGQEVTHPLKRQTCSTCFGGFIVDRNGQGSNLKRVHPHRVDCRVLTTVNTTLVITEIGEPTTIIVPQSTAKAMSTTIISTTTTLTEVAARPTKYAACASNNVVNMITDIDGNKLVFDRVIYRPSEGFLIQNELVANTTSAENCCIACQNTPNCAGSFYAPSIRECHLWLTQPFIPPTPSPPTLPPYGNYSHSSSISQPTGYPIHPSGYPIRSSGYPTAAPYHSQNSSHPYPTAVPFPTAISSAAIPISTGLPINTCPAGSLSLYLGTVRGQEDFPEDIALVFSNGPCGRFSISPIPVDYDGPEVKMLRLGRA